MLVLDVISHFSIPFLEVRGPCFDGRPHGNLYFKSNNLLLNELFQNGLAKGVSQQKPKGRHGVNDEYLQTEFAKFLHGSIPFCQTSVMFFKALPKIVKIANGTLKLRLTAAVSQIIPCGKFEVLVQYLAEHGQAPFSASLIAASASFM